MKRSLIALALISLVVTGAALAAAPTKNPSVGTWKLNLAKSTSQPEAVPQSLLRVDEDRGGGSTEVTVRGVDAKGKAMFTHFTWKYDGKPYPYSYQGQRGPATISGKLAKDGSVAFTIREGGRVTITGTQTISPDGKTLTRVAQAVGGGTSTLVYDRQ